ncbi:hypothetical protein EBZ38_04645 [bacterium]|jgi:predicted transcriptional regulator|nr:hypothetical protein [bacterium]
MITHEKLKQMLHLENKSQREISQELGISEACVSQYAKKYGLRRKPEERYIGKRFGILTGKKVVGQDDYSHNMIECVCDCGNTIVIVCHSLTSGNTKSCGCEARKRGKDHANYRGYENIQQSYWSSIIKGADKRNLEMSISVEYAWSLYEKQGKKCAVTGVPIFFPQTRKTANKSTASLDRIDNTKGYIEGNVQWVHKKINQIKMDLTIEDFFELCKSVVNYNNLLEKQNGK